MQTMDLNTLLAENTYPGRGIVLGLDETGKKAVAAYFIMGRSENSRNRVLSPERTAVSSPKPLMRAKWLIPA